VLAESSPKIDKADQSAFDHRSWPFRVTAASSVLGAPRTLLSYGVTQGNFCLIYPHFARSREIFRINFRWFPVSKETFVSSAVFSAGAGTQEKRMNPILNNACLAALLCGAVTIATPALAQGAADAAAGANTNAGVGVGPERVITGINGPVTTPRPSAIDRTTAQNTINSGAGTTRRTVNQAGHQAGNSAAAELNSKAQANANAGASVSPGVAASGDISSADAANNAASVNRSTQTGAGKMTRQARANADAAEAETTRQLNQQQASATAGTTVQQ
jgi:hypothetical protein